MELLVLRGSFAKDIQELEVSFKGMAKSKKVIQQRRRVRGKYGRGTQAVFIGKKELEV